MIKEVSHSTGKGIDYSTNNIKEFFFTHGQDGLLCADCENQESGSESLSFRMLFNTCAGTSSPKIAGESRLTLTD